MLNYQRVPGFVPFFGDSIWRSYKINMEYPLVICHGSLLNITTSNNGKSTITGPCSIVFVCLPGRVCSLQKSWWGSMEVFLCHGHATGLPQHWVGPNIELYHVEIYHDYSEFIHSCHYLCYCNCCPFLNMCLFVLFIDRISSIHKLFWCSPGG